MRNFLIISAFLLAFSIVTQSQQRPNPVLMEVFSSSTCGPCLAGNQNIKDVLFENNGHFVLIKYQMNWPSPGDPYYTEEGRVRNDLYNNNYVPWLWIDGATYNINPHNLTNAILVQRQNSTSNFVEIDIDYSIEGQSVTSTVTVNPLANTGSNLRLYAAIVERITYNNELYNGEKEFHQVFKKFMPDANGILLDNLPANIPVEFELEWTFQGNYRLPANSSNPINNEIEHSVENFENLAIVAWVQNTSNRRVQNAWTKSFKQLVSFKTIDSNGTISANLDGIDKEGDFLVNIGSEVVFTATPNQNYLIKNWRVNGNIVPDNISNELIVSDIDKDFYVSVEFKLDGYPVKYGVLNNTGGTITATASGAPIQSDDNVTHGSKVVFNATPEQGYRLLTWRVNDTVVPDFTDNQFVVESLVEAINVSVEFYASSFIVNYSTVNPFGTLTATLNDIEIEQGEFIARGSRVVFNAYPIEGHNVIEWRNNGVRILGNTTNEYVINSLNTGANVTVEFSRENKVLLSIEITPEIAGTVSGANEFYVQNDEVTITAVPNEGWRFVNWTKNSVEQSNNEAYTFIITEDINLCANFEIDANIRTDNLSEVILYPNPVMNELKITNLSSGKGKIEIFNVSGILISTFETSKDELSIDVSNYISGQYIIRFTNSKTSLTKKIIKK